MLTKKLCIANGSNMLLPTVLSTICNLQVSKLKSLTHKSTKNSIWGFAWSLFRPKYSLWIGFSSKLMTESASIQLTRRFQKKSSTSIVRESFRRLEWQTRAPKSCNPWPLSRVSMSRSIKSRSLKWQCLILEAARSLENPQIRPDLKKSPVLFVEVSRKMVKNAGVVPQYPKRLKFLTLWSTISKSLETGI